jgi:hypothetical protein
MPFSETREVTRLERPHSETPDEVPARDRPTASESPVVRLPDVTEPAERADPFPEPDRQTAKVKAGIERSLEPIAEETAEARPEATVGTSIPARSPRSPGQDAEVVRRDRAEATEKVPIAVEQAPGVAERANTSEPQPLVARGSEMRDVARISRGSPRSEAIDEGTTGAMGGKQDAAATVPSRLPQRIGRTARAAPDSGTIERTRPGEAGSRASDTTASGAGAPPATGTGPRDALAAGRAAIGDPAGEGLVPNVVRSELEGAIGKGGGKVPAPYRLRTSPAREKIAFDMGANPDSERAVAMSLKWLADHQHPKGYWEPIESTLGKEPENTARFNNPQERERSGFQSEAGLTALAVLAFLAKGYTHEDNPYADNVGRALEWLVSQQDSQGFLGGRSNQYARMYCHGMATIALGEAYGITKDAALREPLVRAIQYILDTQNGDGGWRYFKGNEGDMSMFGWQLMALKSARTAGIAVPASAMNKAIDFLIANGDDLKTRNLSRFGGLAAYRSGKGEQPKPSMTAESLFCKQMLGIKRTNKASVEAVEYLEKNLPRRSRMDLYYWYYGTLAMYHHGGEGWEKWNEAVRDILVGDQRTDGDFAGSWNPRAPWGDYGGRVFSTALSTLCLQVYYRFFPEDAERIEQSAGTLP